MKIGIIGAGQLGRMLALAGYPLGINCTFLDSDSNSPAGLVSAIHVGEMDNMDHLNSLAAEVDIVTYEFENISVEALKAINPSVQIYPQITALATAQDRLLEKQLFDLPAGREPLHATAGSCSECCRRGRGGRLRL